MSYNAALLHTIRAICSVHIFLYLSDPIFALATHKPFIFTFKFTSVLRLSHFSTSLKKKILQLVSILLKNCLQKAIRAYVENKWFINNRQYSLMYFNIDQKQSNTAMLKFLQADTFRNVLKVYSQIRID